MCRRSMDLFLVMLNFQLGLLPLGLRIEELLRGSAWFRSAAFWRSQYSTALITSQKSVSSGIWFATLSSSIAVASSAPTNSFSPLRVSGFSPPDLLKFVSYSYCELPDLLPILLSKSLKSPQFREFVLAPGHPAKDEAYRLSPVPSVLHALATGQPKQVRVLMWQPAVEGPHDLLIGRVVGY